MRKTASKFIIKEDIVKKYNTFLNEVINYYIDNGKLKDSNNPYYVKYQNKPTITLYSGVNNLNTFTIAKSGTDELYVDIILKIQDFIKASKFLIKKYPYLVPFFHVYTSLLDFVDTNFDASHLEEINLVIKKIRKEKSTTQL